MSLILKERKCKMLIKNRIVVAFAVFVLTGCASTATNEDAATGNDGTGISNSRLEKEGVFGHKKLRESRAPKTTSESVSTIETQEQFINANKNEKLQIIETPKVNLGAQIAGNFP